MIPAMDSRRLRLLSDRVFGAGFLLLFVVFLHHASAGQGAERHGPWLLLWIAAAVLTLTSLMARLLLPRP